jgi:plastocyanin
MSYPKWKTSIFGMLMGLLALVAVGCTANSSGSEGPGAAIDKRSDARQETPPANHSLQADEKNPNQVVIDNFRFEPRELTVAAGAKVTWVNRDDVPHTATSTAKPRSFDSKTLDTDQQFSHVFKTPGTFEYFCIVHPHMKGKVIVK